MNSKKRLGRRVRFSSVQYKICCWSDSGGDYIAGESSHRSSQLILLYPPPQIVVTFVRPPLLIITRVSTSGNLVWHQDVGISLHKRSTNSLQLLFSLQNYLIILYTYIVPFSKTGLNASLLISFLIICCFPLKS